MSETILEPAVHQESEAGTTRRMTLNMGPQHPSTHGVLRVVLELDGEFIEKATPEIGYLHTGIEKQCEALNWQQVITLTDRVGLEIPPKAQWMRVMLAELTRINSHLVWLGTHALDMGAMTMFFLTFREREDLLRLFEMFSGQRLMTSYIRIGGLALDPPRGWEKLVHAFLADFPSKLDEYETLLNNNPIWLRRTKGIGMIPVEQMLDVGITGPLIRAAGIPLDARKMTPYSSYEKFDFMVPTSTDNDVFARYTVRMAEMRESLKIVQQAMDGMPEGPTRADAHRVVLPEREKMKTQMEALIYHFKIVTEGIAVPEGEVFQVVESPRGELGYYVVSDGTAKPLRVHMRTPSFANLQGLPRLIEKRQIADAIAVMGSLDFVLGDCDR